MIIKEEDRQILLGALDTFGEILARYNHAWTEGERSIYEQALIILKVNDRPNFLESGEEA